MGEFVDVLVLKSFLCFFMLGSGKMRWSDSSYFFCK